ncbi:MAG: hypothetical protein DSM106950_32695 [Stigonema ocellatum SAG 48.90 = DSM 106950]|nr:hypothetical protein [Stigonema ocellatum SAG 48.90 = DSM 106950]
MLNKSLAFSLLAAGMMIAPTAAFAGTHTNQSQNNHQSTEQNGSATNGSTNAQESNTTNVQQQINKIKSHTHFPSYHLGIRPNNGHSSQRQNSVQGTSQNGAADNGSTNAQSSNTKNNQSEGTRVR